MGPDGVGVEAAATRGGTRTSGIAANGAAEQIGVAVRRALAVRIGAALALNAARAPIDLGVAAARPRDVASAAEGSADRSRRIAKRAAQRYADAYAQPAPQPPAAADDLSRRRGRKCQGTRRQSTNTR